MHTTTNTPTLLACLRAIAESGKTDKCYRTESYIVELVWKDGNWTTWTRAKDVGDWDKKEIDECLLKIEKALIQIVVKELDEQAHVSPRYTANTESVEFSWWISRDGERIRKRLALWVGLDGIQNMPHALAVGITQVWNLEVKE